MSEYSEQTKFLNGMQKRLIKKELKALPAMLWEDEQPAHIANGRYADKNGCVVATDRRVVFFDKGVFGQRVEDFGYDKISSVQFSTGMATGSITIFASGNKAEIKSMSKEAAKHMGEYIRSKLSSGNGSTSPAAHAPVDVADQLGKLAALKEQGVLSEEEFAAQKAKLLG